MTIRLLKRSQVHPRAEESQKSHRTSIKDMSDPKSTSSFVSESPFPSGHPFEAVTVDARHERQLFALLLGSYSSWRWVRRRFHEASCLRDPRIEQGLALFDHMPRTAVRQPTTKINHRQLWSLPEVLSHNLTPVISKFHQQERYPRRRTGLFLRPTLCVKKWHHSWLSAPLCVAADLPTRNCWNCWRGLFTETTSRIRQRGKNVWLGSPKRAICKRFRAAMLS